MNRKLIRPTWSGLSTNFIRRLRLCLPTTLSLKDYSSTYLCVSFVYNRMNMSSYHISETKPVRKLYHWAQDYPMAFESLDRDATYEVSNTDWHLIYHGAYNPMKEKYGRLLALGLNPSAEFDELFMDEVVVHAKFEDNYLARDGHWSSLFALSPEAQIMLNSRFKFHPEVVDEYRASKAKG
jgi:hypothetical protein